MTSISGAVSGLDTATIINQLVSIDAAQQNLIKSRQSSAQKAADAYTALITSLNGLATQAKALANTSAWQGSKVTSSASSVTATATGVVDAALTFDVTSVAARHTLISAGTASSTAEVVASGPVQVLNADGSVRASLNVGNGTLAEVVSAINASSEAGVRASAVQVAPGQYRLQVSSTATGAASEFSLTGVSGGGSPFSAMDELVRGQDATIKIGGSSPSAYTVTSATNTFNGIVPGLSITVSKEETGVTVTSASDGSAVAAEVKKLVDTANSVLSDLASKSAYNTTTKSGGAFFGEATVRNLQQSILGLVAGAGAPGIELTRGGKITFNESAFTQAFTADPAAVAAKYGASVSFAPNAGVSGGVELQRSSSLTKTGSYAVGVAVAAAREQWRVDPPGGVISGQTVVVVQGNRTISYIAGPGETLADAMGVINTRMAAAGINVGVAALGASLVFSATSFGSGGAFSVSLEGVAGTQLVAGTDVAGTIDGKAATGSGQFLTLNDASSGAHQLSLKITASAADVTAGGGNLGTVEYKSGLANQLTALIEDATKNQTGTLQRAKQARLDSVSSLQDQIDAWDRRLEARRAQLTRQFTAMETALSALQSSASSLVSALSQ